MHARSVLDARSAVLSAAALAGRRRTSGVGGGAVRGFTLVELVVVLTLVGILAVVAVARMPSDTTFRLAASADELAALVRHAHKRAIALRAPVWVRIDAAAGTVRLCLDALPACAQPLPAPAGGAARWAAPAGTTLSATPALAAFSFDGLGRVQGGTGATTELALDGATATAAVRVWNETGLAESRWVNK